MKEDLFDQVTKLIFIPRMAYLMLTICKLMTLEEET